MTTELNIKIFLLSWIAIIIITSTHLLKIT